jgi:hypothetical protein
MRPAAPGAVERRQTSADVIRREGGGGRRVVSWPVEDGYEGHVVTMDDRDGFSRLGYEE